MKYLVHIHMLDGEVHKDLFFDTMEKIEQYVNQMNRDLIPYKKAVVYDAYTKEAVNIFRR